MHRAEKLRTNARLNARPRPAVIYGFRYATKKDARLKVSRGWRALQLSGTFYSNRSRLRDADLNCFDDLSRIQQINSPDVGDILLSVRLTFPLISLTFASRLLFPVTIAVTAVTMDTCSRSANMRLRDTAGCENSRKIEKPEAAALAESFRKK